MAPSSPWPDGSSPSRSGPPSTVRPATLLFFLSVGEEGPQLGAGRGQRQLETKFLNVQAVLLQDLGLGYYYCDITSDFNYLFLGENKYFGVFEYVKTQCMSFEPNTFPVWAEKQGILGCV